MGTTLLVAAGGGGDAITAAALGPALGLTEGEPAVMTYAWDRLIVDPLPGPRSAREFTGLREPAPGVYEIDPDVEPVPPAGSTLPRLARELAARLFLLDPTDGAVGMATQIAATAQHVGADRLALVDVGGDALADGPHEGLRSPLADLLALAACLLVDLPAELLVPAVGIDGELPADAVLARLRATGGGVRGHLGAADVKSTRSVYAWHPSEASGLLALAAEGVRGVVEVRDSACRLTLDDDTARVFAVDTRRLSDGPAAAAQDSRTLDEASDAVRAAVGISEMDYERRKAAGIHEQPSRAPHPGDLVAIDRWVHEAARDGVDFVSVRRLAELHGVRASAHLVQFRELLAEQRADRYLPPVYRVRSD